MHPFTAALRDWSTFYFITATAAATLMGLMFVGVTFAATQAQKLSVETARPFIDPSFNHFLWVILTGAVLNIPVLDSVSLGAVLLALGIVRCVAAWGTFRRLVQISRINNDFEWSDWAIHVVLPGTSHALVLWSSIAFFLSFHGAFISLAIATLLLLYTGLQNSWEQLIWLAFQSKE
ncbi:MAG TPA: hypothetical protein VL588_04490 [Bdellovibrionota bacterium]|jgi:hypothetical protein|nr:hypothetical protein [Bdellovibrionota bacterium]